MSRVLSEYRLLAFLVGVSAVVALSAIPVDRAPRGIAILGVFIGLIYYWVASRRERRRQRLMEAPFPESWREILERRVPLYSLLSPSEQQRFESEIQVFLGEQRIYPLGGPLGRPLGGPLGGPLGAPLGALGPQGPLDPVELPSSELPAEEGSSKAPPLTDEARLLIAASAATLLLGRPEWRLPTVRDIVVYPTAFAEETYKLASADPHAHTVGMVHAQGPILLSLEALEHSYPVRAAPATTAVPPGNSLGLSEPVLPHVGLHEFAHVLDFIASSSENRDARPNATGVPGMLPAATAARWHHQLAVERERLLAAQSILSPYGLKSEAELFAVSVESFFQDALRMRVYHPDLYALLSEFFNQDPAARLVAHHAAFVFRPWFALGPTARYTA